jgi:hypothetical protein
MWCDTDLIRVESSLVPFLVDDSCKSFKSSKIGVNPIDDLSNGAYSGSRCLVVGYALLYCTSLLIPLPTMLMPVALACSELASLLHQSQIEHNAVDTYTSLASDFSIAMNFRCSDINSGDECDLTLGDW